MAPAEDKRDTHRLQILGELRGEVMVFQPMAIKEISRGGAQIETGFPLHLDSLHDFRLTLGDRSLVVKARVVHCSITDVEQEQVLYRAGHRVHRAVGARLGRDRRLHRRRHHRTAAP